LQREGLSITGPEFRSANMRNRTDLA
jgi:hypothetical protein